MPDSHGPIEERHQEQMRALGIALDATFNPENENGGEKKYGFCLLVFDFGEPTETSRMNYVCNAKRKDMVKALEDFIAREKQHLKLEN